MLKSFLIFLIFTFGQSTFIMANETNYNQVNLSENATVEVDNDILTAILFVQQAGKQTQKLSQEVNEVMAWALNIAKPFKQVKFQILQYQTTPNYRKGALAGWTVKQNLRLESKDMESMNQLIGQLQKHLAIENIAYVVSKEKRHKAESELIQQAIERFKQRAQLIAKSMDKAHFKLVKMTINTNEYQQPMPMMRMKMSASSNMAAPATAAGTQQITVSINGIVELY